MSPLRRVKHRSVKICADSVLELISRKGSPDRPEQGDKKPADRGQQGHRNRNPVGKSHVLRTVGYSPDQQKEKAKKSHRKKEAYNA